MLDLHFVPAGFGILPYLNIGGFQIPTYSLCVALAFLAAGICYGLLVRGAKENRLERWLIVLAALAGGLVGSKIPVIIEGFSKLGTYPDNLNILLFQKSIVGGLIGGMLCVIAFKRAFRIKLRLGNEIAPAAALGMALGRLGCFFAGCCYGIPTQLPWGVDFGDGILRYPTQLFEAGFCLVLFVVLLIAKFRWNPQPGALFRALLNAYFGFRFGLEFLRATDKQFLFSVYQWICLVCLLWINRKWILSWLRPFLSKSESEENVG